MADANTLPEDVDRIVKVRGPRDRAFVSAVWHAFWHAIKQFRVLDSGEIKLFYTSRGRGTKDDPSRWVIRIEEAHRASETTSYVMGDDGV